MLVVMFRDGSKAHGETATELLESLCGGWNPNTVPELRRRLCARTRVSVPETMTDDEFVRAFDASGVWAMKWIPRPLREADIPHAFDLLPPDAA